MKTRWPIPARPRIRGRAIAGLALPLLLALPGCRPGPPKPIPVLMYHQVAPDPGGDVWTVSTAEFRRQIADLKAAGFRTILPADLPRIRPWKFWLPRKPVIITFDDGLLGAATEAEPILREAGFKAISYLILGFIADTPAERKQYRADDCLTWEEVRAMQARGVFVCGVHSFSHTPAPALQAQETAECRNIFRRKTEVETRDYCYPYGGAPDPLRQAVADAGYRTAMICEDRLFSPGPGTDLLRIPRVSVYGGRHAFAATPLSGPANGAFRAEVKNEGVPLPVRGVLRDAQTGRTWPFQPERRLDGHPQTWLWTNLPPQLSAAALQIEIWEQNGLFRYRP